VADIYVTEYTIGGNTYKYKDSEITTELEGKVDKIYGHRLITPEEIDKLENIEAGAQVNIPIDNYIDYTNESTNPVQNKVLAQELDDIRQLPRPNAQPVPKLGMVVNLAEITPVSEFTPDYDEETINIATFTNNDGSTGTLKIPFTSNVSITPVENLPEPKVKIADFTINGDDGELWAPQGGGSGGGGQTQIDCLYIAPSGSTTAGNIDLSHSYVNYDLICFIVCVDPPGSEPLEKISTLFEKNQLVLNDYIRLGGSTDFNTWLRYQITAVDGLTLRGTYGSDIYVETIYGIKLGGSIVEVTPITATGTKIATIRVNGIDHDIWSPDPPVDSALDSVSENPVQNKVIKNALDGKVDTHGTDRLMTDAEGTKLSGIEAGAQVNVQSDWNQSDSGEDDFIKNKPSIPNNIDDLTDVTITNPTDGQVLKYNNGVWENGTGGGTGTIIDVQVDNVSVVTSGVANIDTMTGAGAAAAGSKGLVPAPASGDNEKFLRGDGTWQTVSGGGTTVVANPSGTATDTLNKVQIDNTIYDIDGSGSANIEEMTKAQYEQITPLQDSVYFVYGTAVDYVYAQSNRGTTYKYSDVSDVENKLAIFVNLNNTIYTGFFFDVTTRISTLMTSDDLSSFAEKLQLLYVTNTTNTLTQNQNTPTLYWVNGSNQDTLYLDATDLTNVGIKSGYSNCISYLYYNKELEDNSIYLNERQYSNTLNSGSSSSGSGYTQTLLWDYEDDNEGVIPYQPFTVTLRQSIDNFDELVIENVSSSSDITDQTWKSSGQWRINVDMLNDSEILANYIAYTSYGSRSSRYHIVGTTFEKTANNASNINGLVRVYGIKYTGGGSGGGNITGVDLTQAQYNQLAPEQKNDPTKMYFVSDSSDGGEQNGLFNKSVIQSQNILSEFEYRYKTLESKANNVSIYPPTITHYIDGSYIPFIDLGASNTSFTAYAVIKVLTSGGNYNLISAMNANSTGKAPNLYTNGNKIYTSVHGTDTDTGIASNVYNVVSLVVDGTNKKAKFYINGVAYYSGDGKSFTTSGRYVGFSGSMNQATMLLVNTCKSDFIYGAVVAGIETDADIIANHNLLMTEYADYIGQ